MAVGIFARVSASNYSALMDEGGFKTAANILIAAGALVMIIGAIGCCGVMKEKKWLLLLVRYIQYNRSAWVVPVLGEGPGETAGQKDLQPCPESLLRFLN